MIYNDMRTQIKHLQDGIETCVNHNDPQYSVLITRCDILLDHIDDLETGRLPVKKSPTNPGRDK